MQYEDQSPFRHNLSIPMHGVLAVGWLDGKADHPVGEYDPELAQALHAILTWSPVLLERSYVSCSLCSEYPKNPITGERLGHAQLWIPCGQVWFASPDRILHYMEVHAYAPPSEYVSAATAYKPYAPARRPPRRPPEKRYLNLMRQHPG